MLWKGVSPPCIFKDKQNQRPGASQKVVYFFFLVLFFFDQEVRIYDLLSSLKFLCFSDSKALLNIVWNIKRQRFYPKDQTDEVRCKQNND